VAMTMSSDPVLALAEPGLLADPGPAYAWLLEHRPVFWHDGLKTLLVSRYVDGVMVLRDSAQFGSDYRRAGEDVPPASLSVQTLDAPEHTAIRHLLADAFRRLDYPALQDVITRSARDRLAVLADRPSFDFVTELAEPLAWSTILGILGVPEPDLSWFGPVADAIVDGMDAAVWPELAQPARAARAQLSALAGRWLTEAADGGVVAFAAAQAGRYGVDLTVLENTLRVLVHAGYTSASKLLSLGAATLLSQPGALLRLAGWPPGPAIEELVRYVSPVRAVARVCVVDTVIGGHPVAAGEVVTVLLGAANRDPARFADPGALRFDRAPNPHLGFGRGAHSCLGTALAALQARVLFAVLARHYPDARITAAPIFRRNLTLRGLRSMGVTLRSCPSPDEGGQSCATSTS
jgi:cytochrome P450